MKLIRIFVCLSSGLAALSSAHAGPGKWDAVYSKDYLTMDAAPSKTLRFAGNSPTVMLCWFSETKGALPAKEEAGRFLPIEAPILSAPKRYFTLHTDLAIDSGSLAALACAMGNSGDFATAVPVFLEKWRARRGAQPLPGLTDLAKAIKARAGELPGWRLSVERVRSARGTDYVLDVRLMVEIPKADSELRRGLEQALLGDVESVDRKTFLPLLDGILKIVESRAGLAQYPAGGAVLRQAFGCPSR
jgi:hypothetical protein